MNTPRRILCVLAVLAITAACGYRMVGFDSGESANRFVVDSVVNQTGEPEYAGIAEDEVLAYLSSTGSLAKPGTSPDFRLDVTLSEVRTSSAVTGTGGQATSISLRVHLTLTATPADGDDFVTNKYQAAETFVSGSSVSDTIAARNDAFARAIRSALSDFRHEFR